MENTALTNLRKAKLIIEAEIERMEKGGRTEDDIVEESMQLLKNGLSCDDYEAMYNLQSQRRLDFNNLDITSVFAIDGHDERAVAILEYLVSRLHLFMESSIGNWDKMSTLTDTMFIIVRILAHMN